MNEKIVLKNVPIAFADGLFTAKQYEGVGPFTFSVTALIPKDDPQYKELQAAEMRVAKNKWAEKAAKIVELSKEDKQTRLIKDGDKQGYEGFEDHWSVRATRGQDKGRPDVRDRDGKSPLTIDDGKPYSGAICNVIIELWPQDNKFGKCVRATLLGVQFIGDGKRFSGGSAAADNDFENMADGKDDDDVVG